MMEQSTVQLCDRSSEALQPQGSSSLTGSVLVLNRFYMAVHVISVRRAMVMLYGDVAEVIHVENGKYFNYDFESWVDVSEFELAELSDSSQPIDPLDWVRSVNFSIRAPRIIRLNYYDKVPRLNLRFNRRNLFARDKNLCQYCGTAKSLKQLSFDHVLPRSRGGKTNWENVVCCCLKCNGRKGDRLPEEAGMKLIRRPTKPQENPLMQVKLNNPKYEVWRTFIKGSPLS